jgi:hypothetical protein
MSGSLDGTSVLRFCRRLQPIIEAAPERASVSCSANHQNDECSGRAHADSQKPEKGMNYRVIQDGLG